MADVLTMYAVAFGIFMGLGIAGYILTKGSGTGYLLAQLLTVPLVLFGLSDVFGATGKVWMMYLFGFGAYIIGFPLGVATAPSEENRIVGVIIVQVAAFGFTFMIFPWMFGVVA
jgi:hypothetical protein